MCKVCGRAMCKQCALQELLVYTPDTDLTASMNNVTEAYLAVIKVVGVRKLRALYIKNSSGLLNLPYYQGKPILYYAPIYIACRNCFV